MLATFLHDYGSFVVLLPDDDDEQEPTRNIHTNIYTNVCRYEKYM